MISIFQKLSLQDKTGHFMVPYDGELECKQNVVVYDSKSSTLREEDFRKYSVCCVWKYEVFAIPNTWHF